MIVVGLTGAIGSGKSTVARMLARRGAVVIDADTIVHELQRPAPRCSTSSPSDSAARSSPPTARSIGRSWRRSCSATSKP